jgi:hypothetical protein
VKLQARLAIAAGALFALSFFLPALGDSSGFECLRECWHIFTRSAAYLSLSLVGRSYFSGFVVANCLFVALVGALLVATSHARLRLWTSGVLLLQVFSWLILNLIPVWHGERLALGAGYFLWLLSYLMLFGAHSVRNRKPNQSPDPASTPVMPRAGHESR